MSLIIRAIVITVAPVGVGDKIEGFWVDANALDHLGESRATRGRGLGPLEQGGVKRCLRNLLGSFRFGSSCPLWRFQ